jgi:hypothetical protein
MKKPKSKCPQKKPVVRKKACKKPEYQLTETQVSDVAQREMRGIQ